MLTADGFAAAIEVITYAPGDFGRIGAPGGMNFSRPKKASMPALTEEERPVWVVASLEALAYFSTILTVTRSPITRAFWSVNSICQRSAIAVDLIHPQAVVEAEGSDMPRYHLARLVGAERVTSTASECRDAAQDEDRDSFRNRRNYGCFHRLPCHRFLCAMQGCDANLFSDCSVFLISLALALQPRVWES